MHQQSILVVDDELQARKGLAELLERRQYRVKRARFGKEAVNKAMQLDIALILMDLKMRGKIDGIEAVRQIQMSRPNLPAILVTAFSDNAEYQRRVQEANLKIAGWVDKPIAGPNKKLLLSTVEKEWKKIQLRNLIDVAAEKGMQPTDEFKLYETMTTLFDLDIPGEAIEEIRNEISSSVAPAEVLKELARAISETEENFSDIQQRQFAFAQFKTVAMEHLWDAYQSQSKYHRQLALLIRMSVRKLSSLQLTGEHLAALKLVLESLSRDRVTLEDVVACKKVLRRSGIETLIELGEKTDELLAAYDEGVAKK